MMLFTSTQNQKNLPRYFSRVFDMACNMNFGQLDFALSDGRVFRAIGRNQGPIAQLNIHNFIINVILKEMSEKQSE